MVGEELHKSILGPLLYRLYRCANPYGRRICLSLVKRLERGQMYSRTLRQIFADYHGVKIGAYSYGECFLPGAFPRGVTVGRYVSVAAGVRIFRRNHPMERLSMHPFFYNKALGIVDEDTIESAPLQIGHDAWVGERAMIMPGCRSIGIGAVVGAGSIVTKDVPDFAVVAGNPARLIRLRFPEHTCQAILESKWWERSIEEILQHKSEMLISLGDDPAMHPLLSSVRERV